MARGRRRLLVGSAVVVALGFVLAWSAHGAGVTANRRAWLGEAWAARAAWRYLVPAAVRAAANPTPSTPEVLKAAREHWADHCASCHANDGSGQTPVGRHVFPPAPDMRAASTQALSDGELFYAIEHGMPWTAMPAWGTGSEEGARASWALVRFIRHLPALTADEILDMERFNPKSAAGLARDRDIQDFLKGGKQ